MEEICKKKTVFGLWWVCARSSGTCFVVRAAWPAHVSVSPAVVCPRARKLVVASCENPHRSFPHGQLESHRGFGRCWDVSARVGVVFFCRLSSANPWLLLSLLRDVGESCSSARPPELTKSMAGKLRLRLLGLGTSVSLTRWTRVGLLGFGCYPAALTWLMLPVGCQPGLAAASSAASTRATSKAGFLDDLPRSV